MFKKGDRVYVDDPALEQLRMIMRRTTGQEPAPNHYGVVEDPDFGDGSVLINFDDGSGAPYLESQTHFVVPHGAMCSCERCEKARNDARAFIASSTSTRTGSDDDPTPNQGG